MRVCLPFLPYLAWTEQLKSLSTEEEKKKGRTTSEGKWSCQRGRTTQGMISLKHRIVILVICGLIVGNMTDQLPLGHIKLYFSDMAAFLVLSLCASASSSASSHSSK